MSFSNLHSDILFMLFHLYLKFGPLWGTLLVKLCHSLESFDWYLLPLIYVDSQAYIFQVHYIIQNCLCHESSLSQIQNFLF